MEASFTAKTCWEGRAPAGQMGAKVTPTDRERSGRGRAGDEHGTLSFLLSLNEMFCEL